MNKTHQWATLRIKKETFVCRLFNALFDYCFNTKQQNIESFVEVADTYMF